MSIERAREHLRAFGRQDDIIEFDVSSATVELAARALGIEGARIAKTLSFLIDDRPLLVVAAGDAKVDNRKYREEFGAKARMIDREMVEALVGHAAGGVCPFGAKAGVVVYLDVSLRRFDTVYPACGSSNSAIMMTCDELETASAPERWVDVCRLPSAD